MSRPSWVIGSALLLAAAALPAWAGETTKKAHSHEGHFDKCAIACFKCMRECESCASHCVNLVAQGKKEHLLTLGTCADCSQFCLLAGKTISHGGPMALLACEVCAKACDTCGKACETVGGNDDHMKECAKSCRDCAAECRAMIKACCETTPSASK